MGVVDLGGSHVSAARARPGAMPDPATHLALDTVTPTTDSTLDSIAAAMREVGPVDRWVIAAPDPFDYEAGVCLISGLAKLEELYGVELRAELTQRIDDEQRAPMRFLNDADAAGLGEWWLGAGDRVDRCLFVSLGTGFGSAFVERGAVVGDGPLVPRNGRLGAVAFEDGIADDRLSTRGLVGRLGDRRSPREAADDARAGDGAARRTFRALGRDLSRFLAPWIERFEPDVLVVGGGMSRSLDLMEIRAATAVRAARFPDDAGLVGAAYVAMLDEDSSSG